MVFHSGCWYLVGHDHLRDDLRTFRMDRIAATAPTTGTFTAPDDFDPVTHLTASLARTPALWQVEVHIEAPPTPSPADCRAPWPPSPPPRPAS